MSGHHASAEDPFADLIRSGDPESIARAFHPAVRGLVRAYLFTADPDLIETATSESLLAICRYRHTFRGRARAWAWIRRITVREAARCAKQEARARPPGTLPIDDSRPASIMEALARQAPSLPSEAVADLRARIPNPAWRRIWLLWHEPGARRTHEEIARLTGYTPGSVAVILSRVRSLLNGARRSERSAS